MSGPGTPPETGTIASTDDRYPASAFPITPVNPRQDFDNISQMMSGPGSIFKDLPGATPEVPVPNPPPQVPMRVDDAPKDYSIPTPRPVISQSAGPNASDRDALISTANNLGVDPRDLAAAISYETIGKFDPNIVGGKNGLYRGLIQFGPSEQAKYGVVPGMSFADQMPAVENFLRDRGLQPGSGISEIYRTINGGNPNASLNASDGNGTIQQHIERIKAGHYPNADRFLGAQETPQAPPLPAQAPFLSNDVFEFSGARKRPNSQEGGNILLPEMVVTPQEQETPAPGLGSGFSDANVGEGEAKEIPYKDTIDQLNKLQNLDEPVVNIDPNADQGGLGALMFDKPLTFGSGTPTGTGTGFESNTGKEGKETPSFIQPGSFVDNLTRGVRQVGKGVISTPGNMLYGTGAQIAALAELPGALMGDPVPPERSAYKMFTDLQAANTRGAAQLMGLSGEEGTPQNPVERLAEIGGESLFPAGKATVPLTVVSTGVRALFDNLLSPAYGERSQESKDNRAARAKERRLERMKDGTLPQGTSIVAKEKKLSKTKFAGMVAPGNVPLDRIGVRVNAIVVPQPDGTFVAIPQSSLYGSLNLPPERALAQYKRTGVNLGKFQTEADAHNFIASVNDRVMSKVQTVGGPTHVKTSELALMGALGVFSLGAAFAPQIFGKMRGTTPRLRDARPVQNAAPGTMAYSNRADLANTISHDVNAAPLRIAGAIIKDQNVLQRVRDTFQMQTRGAASNIADSAVRNGVAQGPNFSFRVKVPLAEMQARTNPQIEQYLHLHDTFDDLQKAAQLHANRIAQRIPVAPGPVTVRGLTETDVLQQIGALEKANPNLRKIHAMYKDNLRNFRKFMATGEYSTISGKEYRRLNSANPNEVPFVGVGRVWEDPNYVRQSPFIALGERMRTGMRFRMENEAKGLLVDGIRREKPDAFVRVTERQLAENKHWGQLNRQTGQYEGNVVTIYRRGKKEHYTTDPLLADTLKMDPYFFQNKIADSLYTTKRWAESMTTGVLAPWFSETSFLRNHQIAKVSIPSGPQGLSAPNIIQSVAAIPRQLGPQTAQAIASRLDRGSGGWLNSVFGPGYTQSLGARLQTMHDQSLFAKLEAAGSHRGSVLDHQIRDPNAIHWQRLTQTNNRVLDRAINATKGGVRTFFEGWKNTFGAIHNAPSFAFAHRNRNRASIPELALMSRQLTGDPMSGGQWYSGGRRMRYENESAFGALKTGAVQWGVGFPSEAGRVAVPWFNPSMQGMKRLGQAYADDPKKFVLNSWLYTQLPAMTGYAWNRAIGLDPQGQSYSDYHMNGRSQYNTMMEFYLGVPGRPAAEGIRISRFHELAPLARMMEIAMDHAFRSSKYSQTEDFLNVAANGTKVILGPAMPPLGNVLFAGQGMVGPQGVFEGEGYKRTNQPFDQNAGLPGNIELYARAVAPGLADVLGAGAAAALQATDRNPLGAFMEEAGKRAISKAPISRNLFNMQPPATGNTRYTEELFAKQKAISDLDRFYTQWGLTGGSVMLKDKINPKRPVNDPSDRLAIQSQGNPRSIEGGKIAQQLLGNPIPRGAPGLGQPEPTNPLYKMFAQRLHDSFKRDDPENGGQGFQSLWGRYSEATRTLRTLQKVNAGNFVTWQRYLDTQPETKAFLEENNVNTKSPIAIKNFYETIRQSAAETLLFTIKRVEQEMSAEIGKPIKVEDLQPYNKNGLPEEDAMFDFGGAQP